MIKISTALRRVAKLISPDQVEPADAEVMASVGIHVEDQDRSGTYILRDFYPLCALAQTGGLELLPIAEALQKKGFSFVEIISPCPTYYGRMNRQPTGLDQMRYYRSFTVVRHGANPDSVGLGMTGQIVTGKFVDTERPCLPAPEDG